MVAACERCDAKDEAQQCYGTHGEDNPCMIYRHNVLSMGERGTKVTARPLQTATLPLVAMPFAARMREFLVRCHPGWDLAHGTAARPHPPL